MKQDRIFLSGLTHSRLTEVVYHPIEILACGLTNDNFQDPAAEVGGHAWLLCRVSCQLLNCSV
jgi:hypothetical protein